MRADSGFYTHGQLVASGAAQLRRVRFSITRSGSTPAWRNADRRPYPRRTGRPIPYWMDGALADAGGDHLHPFQSDA